MLEKTGQLQKQTLINAIDADIEVLNTELQEETPNIIEIQVRYKTLQRKFRQLEVLFAKLIEMYIRSGDEDTLQEEVRLQEDVTQRVERLFVLCDLQKESSVSKQEIGLSNRSARSANVAKLPKLNLLFFSGDIFDWPPFWDAFKVAVDDNTDLAPVQKFTYLKGQLKGEALNTILNISVTNSNYDLAVKTLLERYGDMSVLLTAHTQQLLNLGRVENSNDIRNLRKLYDQCEISIRGIQNIKHQSKSPSQMETFSLLTSIIANKLPMDLLVLWNRENHGEIAPNVDFFMKFLKREIETREISNLQRNSQLGMNSKAKDHRYESNSGKDHRSYENNSKISFSKRPFSTGAVLPTISSQTNPTGVVHKCIFCNDNHVSYKCVKAEKMSMSEKEKKIRDANACFRCFRRSHMAKDCKVRDKLRCAICRGHYSTLFCLKCNPTTPNRPKSNNANVTVCNSQVSTLNTSVKEGVKFRTNVLLQTAKINAYGSKRSKVVRCLFDTGSDKSYIKRDLVNYLNCEVVAETKLAVNTFGHETGEAQYWTVVSVHLQDRKMRNQPVSIQALVTPLICADLPKPDIEITDANIQYLQSFDLADTYFETDENIQIDILIGSDWYWEIVEGVASVSHDYPTVLNSKFGCILNGPLSQTKSADVDSLSNKTFNLFIQSNPDFLLDETLRKYWEVESIGIESSDHTEYTQEQQFAVEQIKETLTCNQGRYSVSLPWKSCYKEDYKSIPTNEDIALQRMKSLVIKLKSKPEVLKQYHNAIMESIELGFAEKVAEPNKDIDRPVSYLPHRPVIKTERLTTKIRVVFDASAHKKNQVSLNDCLLAGPTLHSNLVAILCSFRLNRVAFASDIERAFPQIEINERDRDVTRFFWFPSLNDISETNTPDVYRMTRVTFGIISSPFILNLVVKHHLQNYKEEGENTRQVIQDLNTNLYVDDWISGTGSEEEALRHCKEASKIMKAGCMNLRKWRTNCTSLQKKFDEEFDQNSEENDFTLKVLGMSWNAKEDFFEYDLKKAMSEISTVELTKRNILSLVSKLFDPLGLLIPYSIRMKVCFQKLWILGLKWDEHIPKETEETVIKWFEELSKLNTVRIPRWIKVLDGDLVLHGFCDASKDAYAAMIYVVTEDSSELLIAKSRVAPLKKLTVPRLELMSALLLARLFRFVRKADVRFQQANYFCWTDSKIVWHWVRGMPEKQKVFVSNRTTEIRQYTSPINWQYCPGEENPSDVATRGLSIDELRESYSWWHGPKWILKTKNDWPKQEEFLNKEEKSVLEKKQQKIEATVLVTKSEESFLDVLLRKSNSFVRIVRIMAYILRFIHCLKNKVKVRSNLTVKELNDSENCLVLLVQQEKYVTEYKQLKDTVAISTKSKLFNFKPFFDKETKLIRIGGRVQECSGLNSSQKAPIIIPPDHRFTELYVLYLHETLKHATVRQILTQLRDKFWLPRGRQVIKGIVHNCIICRKFTAKPYQTVMGPLPADRIEKAEPFKVVGIDFTGPVYLKTADDQRQKAYICLYTCAVTRAVHIELIENLSTDQFIQSLRRFISRRGICETIICDNAKTFKGAEKQLEKAWLDSQKTQNDIERYTANQRVQWKYIIPQSPWWGGFYERLMRSIKHPLRRILGNAALTYVELNTILSEIEGLLNSRPLTFLSDSTDDLIEPLTPSHFLIGRRMNQFPISYDTDIKTLTDGDFNKRFLYQERLVNLYWDRWRNEYLKELIPVPKMITNSDSPLIGDVVLVGENNVPKQNWSMGIILKLFPGKDGVTRAVEVKTTKGVLKRPVQKLYLLETSMVTNPPFETDSTVEQKESRLAKTLDSCKQKESDLAKHSHSFKINESCFSNKNLDVSKLNEPIVSNEVSSKKTPEDVRKRTRKKPSWLDDYATF